MCGKIMDASLCRLGGVTYGVKIRFVDKRAPESVRIYLV